MAAQEVMPTENDQQHITPLAQQITDLVQDYVQANGMTLQGVLSAIGTSGGALLARAYHDADTAKSVAGRLTIAALAMVDAMHTHDPIVSARRN